MDPHLAAERQPDTLIGQTIGNYRVTMKLGEGGMGAVYLAEHPQIGKKVALKILHAEFASNEDVVSRFFNEAKAVNDIQHPNIVDIVDYGVIQGQRHGERLVYFIMEHIAGLTLSQVGRQEGPIAPERVLSIGLQVADALVASHRCGIVHRDLKPDNIMLSQRGRESDFVKLLDFGIAKLTGGQHGSSRTRTGIVMGTPAYMSPEQCEGRGLIDHRTDIYALGIVLYEMLTGRTPFLGEGFGEILVQHLTQPPTAPSQFRIIPPHLEAVVLKALEKKPDNRFPTMEEMMHALADPVGYVEAHGGVIGFAARPLADSGKPLMGKLTPASLTPVPGSLYQTGPYARAQPPSLILAAAPAPSRKLVFVVGGIVVAAAAAIAAVLATRTAGPSAGHPQPAAGSLLQGAAQLGSGTPEPAPRPDPVAITTKPIDVAGAGAGAGSAVPVPVPVPVPVAEPVPVAPTPSKTVWIDAETEPVGAAIFVGTRRYGVTPTKFEVPRGSGKVIVRFELSSYVTAEREVDFTDPSKTSQNLDFPLDKKPSPHVEDHVVVPASRSVVKRPPGARDPAGVKTPTGKTPPTGHDADGVAKPGDI